MKKFLQILTVIALLIWGALFIYFYATGRIERFLDPSFRIYAMIAGIGFIIVALFNLLTLKKSAGVCNHDHAHGDSCSHEDHDHGHEAHDHHDHDDHGHDHEHVHHKHDEVVEGEEVVAELHEHSHDESASGLAFALLVLIAPILMAAHYSEDSFSMGYLQKWGKIERQMQQKRIADQRKSEAMEMAATNPKAQNPYADPAAEPGNGNADDATADTQVGNGDDPTEAGEASENAENEWGEFTLEDLKKMVPQSSVGDFLLDVPQIFYTAGDRELMDVMEGISVETTAQLMEEAESTEGQTKRLKAFRLFIECCAADARPLSVPVEFPDGMPDYKEMGWYKMIGELHYSKENDEIVPILRIKSLESTVEPVDGLLY